MKYHKGDKPRPLTFKKKLFINKMTETLSPVEAGKAIGISPAAASALLKRPEIKREIEKAFEEVGLTRKGAAKAVKRNLKASTPVYSRTGSYLGEKQEHMAQLKAAELVFKTLGDFAPTKTESTHRHLVDLFKDDDEQAEWEEMQRNKGKKVIEIEAEDAEVVSDPDAGLELSSLEEK